MSGSVDSADSWGPPNRLPSNSALPPILESSLPAPFSEQGERISKETLAQMACLPFVLQLSRTKAISGARAMIRRICDSFNLRGADGHPLRIRKVEASVSYRYDVLLLSGSILLSETCVHIRRVYLSGICYRTMSLSIPITQNYRSFKSSLNGGNRIKTRICPAALGRDRNLRGAIEFQENIRNVSTLSRSGSLRDRKNKDIVLSNGNRKRDEVLSPNSNQDNRDKVMSKSCYGALRKYCIRTHTQFCHQSLWRIPFLLKKLCRLP